MLTVSPHFDLLLSKIEPDETRLTTAQDLVPDVRAHLKEAEELWTVTPHTRLSGSYPRHTAIGNLKDVDMLSFLDSSYLDKKPSVVLNVLHRVLKDCPEALGYTGEVTLRRQRRSIHVHFDELDFHLDVVPAIFADGDKKPLLVPDREWQEWIETHPLGYQTYLSELNAEHNGKVVPMIKLFKYWKDCHFLTRRPKSYWLECLVVRHIAKGWVTTEGLSYAELFTNLLASIYDRFESYLEKDTVPRIPDPMLANNVAWNWDRSHFETFMRRMDESYGWATRALNKSKEDLDDALDLWQKVFKDTFPTAAEVAAVEANKMAAAAITGSLYVSQQGRVSITPPSTGSAYQSPPHRFYGDETCGEAEA